MTERPIIFNGALSLAVVEGRKTVTRRPRKPMHPDVYVGPFGEAGDKLWVREAWRVSASTIGLCEYRCGGAAEPSIDPAYQYESVLRKWQFKTRGGKWAPSIHMPRWASRTTLDVLGVGVERLQDITEEGALAEGFATRVAFIATWDAIYPAMPFHANPWVWRIDFRRTT